MNPIIFHYIFGTLFSIGFLYVMLYIILNLLNITMPPKMRVSKSLRLLILIITVCLLYGTAFSYIPTKSAVEKGYAVEVVDTVVKTHRVWK